MIISCNKYEYEITNESISPIIVSTPIDVQPPPNVDPVDREIVLCENGFANGYPCSGMDLLSQITLTEFGSSFANDNWGWTDRQTGKEYVIQGLNDGTAFIDISNPLDPVYLAKISVSTPSTWRDIKVFKNHAFIVSEANDHGLQIFDLTRLREIDAFKSLIPDTRLDTFGNAHNIAINESTGYAYVIGSQRFSGGPLIIDINDPKNPIEVGGYRNMGYSHDAQIVSYHGPDENFKGKEIYIGSNSDGGSNNKVVIVDVTDKSNPELITTKSYSGSGYAHQSWLSTDHRYLFFGDELDEYYYGGNTKTFVFNLDNLSEPLLHFTYNGTTTAIDHNGYTVGGLFYLSNYTAGLRVMDISQIQNKTMDEIMYFDTYPESDLSSFDGVWNVYPFFQSGIIAISDGQSGLFLVKASE
jgi:choice-of-anchor B domain-containing protein